MFVKYLGQNLPHECCPMYLNTILNFDKPIIIYYYVGRKLASDLRTLGSEVEIFVFIYIFLLIFL